MECVVVSVPNMTQPCDAHISPGHFIIQLYAGNIYPLHEGLLENKFWALCKLNITYYVDPKLLASTCYWLQDMLSSGSFAPTSCAGKEGVSFLWIFFPEARIHAGLFPRYLLTCSDLCWGKYSPASLTLCSPQVFSLFKELKKHESVKGLLKMNLSCSWLRNALSWSLFSG